MTQEISEHRCLQGAGKVHAASESHHYTSAVFDIPASATDNFSEHTGGQIHGTG
jgi:hypothetical protein